MTHLVSGKGSGSTTCVTPGSGEPEVGLDRIPKGWGTGGLGPRGKRRWRTLATILNPIPIFLDVRDTEKGNGVSSPFIPSSLSSALAMAEAGAGLSETVTETTVTVTTEPVRKAGGRCCLGIWDITGREGIELRRVAGGARLENMGGVGLNIWVQRIAGSWDIWSGRDGAEG